MKLNLVNGISVSGILIAALFGFLAPAEAEITPYAGQQNRTIKAMSDDDMQGHLEGKGLGYAKTAELNHYPGPVHLEQLSGELNLSPEQLARIAALEKDMKAEARRLGKLVVEKELALDRLFASGRAATTEVTTATVEIGRLKGALRAVHLNTHVRVRPLLSRHQVMEYDRLRGYGNGGGHGGDMNH